MSISPLPLSTNQKIELTVVGTVLFVLVTIGFFFVFQKFGTDSTVSVILGIISGVIIVWIILSIWGIIKEFSIKGGSFFELSTKMNDIKKEVNESNKEICGKINNLNQNIQNNFQSINSRIDTVVTNISSSKSNAEIQNIENYYTTREKLNSALTVSGVEAKPIDPEKKIPQESLDRIEDLMNQVKILQETLVRTPKLSVNELMTRGNYFVHKKRYDKAIVLFEQLLEKDPENTDALFNKGYSLSELKRENEAILQYKKVLELDPVHLPAINNIAHEYNALKDNKTAIFWADKALKINPNDLHGLNAKGFAYLEMNKNDDAIKLYEKTLKNHPNNASALYNLACAHAKEKRKEVALNFLKQAISFGEKWKEMAKTDPDFDFLKNNSDFMKLLT